MYMVANFLSYLESVELNVLNIAKWNENQESSLFILQTVIFSKKDLRNWEFNISYSTWC